MTATGNTNNSVELLIPQIIRGNRKALEQLIISLQPEIFNLSMRFLSVRQDAEDATQEILVKIITSLGRFEGRSRFRTWTWRIAVNHLLNVRKSMLEQQINFTAFGEDITRGLLQKHAYEMPDSNLLAEEVKIGCTLGMLLCLDRNLRIAYILGEVFSLNSAEAADILHITPVNFRKRLSTARHTLQQFMQGWCGLVNNKNACRCHKRIHYALAKGRVNPDRLQYISDQALFRTKNEMETMHQVAGIFKAHPGFSSEAIRMERIIDIIANLKM